MTYKQLLRRLGDEKAICKYFGVTRQAVEQWRERGKVPALRILQLRLADSRLAK